MNLEAFLQAEEEDEFDSLLFSHHHHHYDLISNNNNQLPSALATSATTTTLSTTTINFNLPTTTTNKTLCSPSLNTTIVQSEKEKEEENVEYAPISCDACRNQHRKCDRTKPACHGCKLRGISCHYNMNFKRRAKSIKQSCCLKQEDVKLLDFYANGYGSLPRKEIEKFLFHHYQSNNNNNKATTTTIHYYNNNEMNELAALYYSIKATTECRLGNCEKSEISYKLAKEYLSKVFDSYSSINVALCYANLCCYDHWFERLDTARFYFQILLFYKDYWLNQSTFKNTTKDTLIMMINIYESTIFNVNDEKKLYPLSFDRFLETIPSLFTYYFKDNNIPVNEAMFHLLEKPHLIDSKNCLELNTFLQTIFFECKQFEEMTFGKSELFNFMYEMIECGTTVGLASKCEIMTPMIEYILESNSKRIVKAIGHARFIVAPMEVLIHVSQAAKYHLSKVKQGIFVNNSTNYIDMLKIELGAYHSMQSRYKIVKYYFYDEIFRPIEEFLQAFSFVEMQIY
ncbi:hypothetical protein ABK040_011218 [Willaertia magna]